MMATIRADTVHPIGRGYDPRELECLGGMYDGHSRRALSVAGIPRGGSCLELAPETGAIARWLGEQVGPTGRVIVADAERATIPAASFDLIHARLVLGRLPHPERLVRKLADALVPGGSLVFSDWQLQSRRRAAKSNFSNTHDVFDAFHAVMRVVLAEGGAEVDWPSRMEGAARAAGLTIGLTAVDESCWRGGRGFCEYLRLQSERWHDRLIEGGMGEVELEAFRRIVGDPKSQIGSYPLTTIVARRPEMGGA